jgi:hypothetical protein
MDMERHDFELDDLVERIKENDHRLVALQVPEGLKMQALEMMDSIEEDSEAKVVLAADPCYGACDLVHDKMRMMGVELVAHMGHSAMNIDSGMPTHFIPVTYNGDPEIDPVVPIPLVTRQLQNLGSLRLQRRLISAKTKRASDSSTRLVASHLFLELSWDWLARFSTCIYCPNTKSA